MFTPPILLFNLVARECFRVWGQYRNPKVASDVFVIFCFEITASRTLSKNGLFLRVKSLGGAEFRVSQAKFGIRYVFTGIILIVVEGI